MPSSAPGLCPAGSGSDSLSAIDLFCLFENPLRTDELETGVIEILVPQALCPRIEAPVGSVC